MSWWQKLQLKRSLKVKKSTAKTRQYQANNPAFIICSVILILFNLSLFDTIISWISLLVGCSVIIRGAIYFAYQKHIPTLRTLNLLALLSAVGLIYSAWPLGLLIGMVNLLVLACALKLMQVRTQRDFYQLVVSLLFLLGCGFIFKQSIVFTLLYSLLSLGVILSLGFFHAPNLTFKRQIKQVSLLCLQALPIGLLLFLLLPQLPPLWQTPKAKSAETGLADKITPGDIARLSQSSELAFRATFETSAPDPHERYWRAIVMEHFDGNSWQIHPARKQDRRFRQLIQQEFSPLLIGPYIDYDIIAEPTQQHWLYALDIAAPRTAKSQSDIWQSNDFQLISQPALVSQYQYAVRSYTQAIKQQPLSDLDKQLNLSLPEQGNPRTHKWVSDLRQQYPLDHKFAAALMAYFKSENFIYTLRPKPMFVDPVDTFLFTQQAGFCSHYASALAYSLRLGGIPARLVTGYQGGELMAKAKQQQYLSIYQYDAHAWVEAWLPESGWQRLDPTTLVAPDRINFGLRQAMQDEGSFLADSPFSLARLTNIALFNNLRLLLADVDYNWSRWVLGFDNQKQQDLFKAIVGKLTPQRLAMLGLGIISIIALLLTLFFIPHWLANRLNPVQRIYQQATQLLAAAGINRQSWQGAEEFNRQVQTQLPITLSEPFNQLSQLYLQLNYQQRTKSASAQKKSLNTMYRHLRQLKNQLKKLPLEAK
jgi:transglutaminase-like putative cysteine protease